MLNCLLSKAPRTAFLAASVADAAELCILAFGTPLDPWVTGRGTWGQLI